jgi:hypothetical protein
VGNVEKAEPQTVPVCAPELVRRRWVMPAAEPPTHSSRIWQNALAICCSSSTLSQGPARVWRTNSISPRTPNSRTYLAKATE